MNIPGFEDLIKQAQAFGKRLGQLKEELAKEIVQASAGGGMVVAEANGQGRILRVKIEPNLVNDNDLEMLEDLVAAAVNQAISKAKQLAAERARALTGGVAIPGLDDLFL